jgi:hypothetical protein
MIKFLPHFILLFPLSLAAQNFHSPILCGNEIFTEIVRQQYPALDEDFNQTFLQARNAPQSRSDEPLTIKVVIHVVWNAEEENLPDSIIYSQLAVLNEDYNRLNADSAALRDIFHTAAGSANIHFELQEIVRVHTDQLFNVDLLGTNLLVEADRKNPADSNPWNNHRTDPWICLSSCRIGSLAQWSLLS